MRALGTIGFVAMFGWFGCVPADAHDCCHHNHYGDCIDCGHHCYPSQSARARATSVGRTANMENFEGKIAEIVYLPGASSDSGMVEARIQTADQLRLVRLAPVGFLKERGLHLREGDTIAGQGFRVSAMGGDLIVATEVRSGGTALSLRDVQGRPAW